MITNSQEFVINSWEFKNYKNLNNILIKKIKN
jgi:hypothetical protein